MATNNKLNDAEVSAALAKIPGWSVEGGKLRREFKFVNFNGAFTFMTSAALIAQEMNHYPVWMNHGPIVRVDLGSAEGGGIGQLDAKLAFAMDEMAQRQLAK